MSDPPATGNVNVISPGGPYPMSNLRPRVVQSQRQYRRQTVRLEYARRCRERLVDVQISYHELPLYYVWSRINSVCADEPHLLRHLRSILDQVHRDALDQLPSLSDGLKTRFARYYEKQEKFDAHQKLAEVKEELLETLAEVKAAREDSEGWADLT